MTDTGWYECPKKSAYSMEYYGSSWELRYMEELENDDSVSKWTKNHGIRIPYVIDGKHVTYVPDFLVEKSDGEVQLVEMKAFNMINSQVTIQKRKFAKKWCADRGMAYSLITKYQ